MKHFLVITNMDKDPSLGVTKEIEKYLLSHQAGCHIELAAVKREGSYHYTDPRRIPEGIECAIVLGGDGTLLQAARDIGRLQLPMMGINLGTLGFLAEVDRASIFSALDRLLEGRFEVEERMMLAGSVYRGNTMLGEDIALNDIVISRDGPLRVVRFNHYVNGEYLNSYNADGIIISTPTGSTGYTLSVGGPLVSPKAEMIIVTPIAPHALHSRSIVLPPEDVVTVELGLGRRHTIESGVAFFDGDTRIDMESGDQIRISRSSRKIRIIRLSHQSFVEVLRKKLS